MQTDRRIKRIAIVGGGTAGWIAASALARKVGHKCSIQLIESPDIPTIGVGEATIPGIIDFLRFVGIDLQDFMHHTRATIKLAIRFIDWLHPGHRFWHPFGAFGVFIDRLPFYHFWHKARAESLDVDLSHFSLEIAMAEANKFIFPGNPLGIASTLKYALHFDAGLVARYLRAYAEQAGVVRLERSVTGVTRRADGFIDEIVFKEGDRLQADLYIDCTGFRGLLIEGAQQTGYVYSSEHTSDDEALRDLLSMPENAKPLTDPRVIRFVTGRRRKFWNRNCISLGLGSGFIEPLESTSIHLICSGVYALLDHFPDTTFDPVNIAHYNDQVIEEFERVRDFIILHYCTSERVDTPYWQEKRRIELPDSLVERMEMYKRTGRIFQKRHEMFVELSWFFVMHGMGLRPQSYDPLVDASDWQEVMKVMQGMRHKVAAEAAAAPTHDSFFPEQPAATASARGGVQRRHA
jgi:tryptophan halogenase